MSRFAIGAVHAIVDHLKMRGTGLTLFKKNVAFFQSYAPSLAAVLEKHQPAPQVRLVPAGTSWNLQLPRNMLYGADPAAEVAGQLDSFFRAPLFYRLDIAGASAVQMGPADLDFLQAVPHLADGMAQSAQPPWPGECHSFLWYGIGLAYGIDRLLAQVPMRRLLLIEPIFDMFYHSLSMHDWQATIAIAKDRGIEIDLFFGAEPAETSRWVTQRLMARLPGAFGGFAIYRAYGTPSFEAFMAQFEQSQPALMHGWGYLEDDLAFTRQSAANLLARPQAGILATPSYLGSDDVTAVLVGSGPSLAGSLAAVRQMKGRAVIISCGSSLRPLLRAGIRPDIHVELERGERNVIVQAAVRAEMGEFTGITALLSVTADPRLAELFDDVAFFVRGGTTTEILAADQIGTLSPAGPGVDHAASGVALALGVRRLVLIGIDLGTRDAASHHVAGTAYDSVAALQQEYRDDPHLRKEHEFPHTLPGNFGGQVLTNERFLINLAHHQDLIQWGRATSAGRVQWYNASDGVRIDGATPIRDPLSVVDQGDIAPYLAALRQRLTQAHLDSKRFGARARLTVAALRDAPFSAHLEQETARLFAQARWPVTELYGCFESYLQAPERDAAVLRIYGGNVNTLLAQYVFVRGGLVLPTDRFAFDRAFIAALLPQMRRWEAAAIATLETEVAEPCEAS